RRRHTKFKCDWSSDVRSSDLVTYGRRNGAWSPAVPEAPVDGQPYSRQDKTWVLAGTGSGGSGGAKVWIDPLPPPTPVHGDLWWDSDQGGLFIYFNDGSSSQWVQAPAPGVFDTTQFVKQSQISGFIGETLGNWTPVVTFGGASVGVAYGAP